MTAQAPYESLTTVDAVQKAMHDDRRVEVRGTEGRWFRATNDTAEGIAMLLADGCQYLAALPERAPVSAGGDAVAWVMTYPNEMPAYELVGAPEFVRSEAHAEKIAAGCETHYGKRATYRALYATSPAPPVGADWRIDDLETSLSVMIEWFDTVAEVAKWTRDNANAAFMARDACEEALNAVGPYAAAPPAEARGVGDGGKPSDAAIAREFWKRWTSTQIHMEAAHELQRMFNDAQEGES